MSEYVKKAISTHTFLWSFTFDVESRGELLDVYGAKGGQWEEDPPMERKQGDDFFDAYMVAQYFNKQARKIFAGNSDEHAACCRYRYKAEHIEGLRYLIENQEDREVFKYLLPIASIRLFLFHSCGILALDVYNMKYHDLADIQRINDFGRRIRIPFLPRQVKGRKPNEDGSICADRLGIVRLVDRTGDAHWEKESVEEFREAIGRAVNGRMDEKERRGLLGPACFIYHLLRNKWRGVESLVEPASDDRMFLVSMIKNDALSLASQSINAVLDDDASWPLEEDGRHLKELIPKRQGNELKDWPLTRNEFRDEIYSVVFADQKNDPTCRDKEMQKELLRKAVYRRWSKWGSLYAVTTLSFVCVTGNGDIVDSVYRPFVTEYTDMAILVLAQRASVEKFDTEASEAVRDADAKGLLSNEQIQKIIHLHEQYVTWQNQVNLVEVTDQEQGIDVYALLREQMGVTARTSRLDKQLEDMYAVANVNESTKLTNVATFFAIVAILIDILVNLAAIPKEDSIWTPCKLSGFYLPFGGGFMYFFVLGILLFAWWYARHRDFK